SADFPTTAGAFDRLFNGGAAVFSGDGFVTRLGNGLPPAPPAAPSLLSPANQATLAQPIVFDWSDVANATSYLIQIDDVRTFPAPLILPQGVSVSRATLGGLPAQPLFGRVRGVAATGASGAFSAVRRFTALAAPPAASLSAVSASPASVVGGSGSTG